MKSLKKVFAVIMALAMIFALSTAAFAATTISTTEDTSVLTLSSTGNTVTYQAVTVDGGYVGNQYYPTTTKYSYTIKTSSTTSVSATITNPLGCTVTLNGNVITGSNLTLTKNTHNTLILLDGDGEEVRTFDIAVVDSNTVHVTIEINCYNTNTWLNTAANQSSPYYSTVSSNYNTLKSKLGFGNGGKMTSVVGFDLAGGSTAMDLLYALAASTNPNITISGSSTYVSAIDGLGEGMCGGMSGWCYVKATNTGNHYTMPMYAASSYTLTEGEHIVWVYTCNFSDIGAAINGTN